MLLDKATYDNNMRYIYSLALNVLRALELRDNWLAGFYTGMSCPSRIKLCYMEIDIQLNLSTYWNTSIQGNMETTNMKYRQMRGGCYCLDLLPAATNEAKEFDGLSAFMKVKTLAKKNI